MEHLIEIGTNLVLGLMGSVIFTAWGVREHLKTFSRKIFWDHNKPFVIWVLVMLVLFSVINSLSPDAASAIKTLVGLDVSQEPAANIMLGWALTLAANSGLKKKINKKPI